MDYLNLPPNPSSLTESLRDIGYSSEAAVADIIDNSIAANAKEINIRFAWNGGKPWLAIFDNGTGMSKHELIDAMKLGSKNPLDTRKKSDLGRFGIGLKTASFSQCRSLSVFTRQGKETNCAIWDLDYVSERGWELKIPTPASFIQNRPHVKSLVDTYLPPSYDGTFVLWEKFDRLDRDTKKHTSENQFNSLLDRIRNHLELVFHRYLSGSGFEDQLVIKMNEVKCSPYDPFNTKNKSTTELQKEVFTFEGHQIVVQPYILPHHSKVSPEEYKLHAGATDYLNEQGFYIYRNKRLIIYGKWFGLLAKKEITKLVRVRVDIPNALDTHWKLDVKKSNAHPPSQVKEELSRIIQRIEYLGKRVQVRKGRKLNEDVEFPIWLREVKDEQIFYKINREHPVLIKLKDELNSDDFLNLICNTLENSFPRGSFYEDLATSPEKLDHQDISIETLKSLYNLFYDDYYVDIDTYNKVLKIEPFASHKDLVDQFIIVK